MADTGNPNVFTTFKGKYEVYTAEDAVSNNETVMLSCVNDVQFTGNFEVGASGVLCTLPDQCLPAVDLAVPCVFSNADGDYVGILTITTNGVVSGDASTTAKTAGISFNISNVWYS